MPKKSRAQEAALGRNLEPLYTALVPACCLHLAQSYGWEHEKCGIHKRGSHEVRTGTVFTEKPDPERYFWKYWVSKSWLSEEFHRSFVRDIAFKDDIRNISAAAGGWGWGPHVHCHARDLGLFNRHRTPKAHRTTGND
ncbi:hypothetical protein B0H13DRAFT_1875053 [Mycena leptocephala]|nr:hypothetical protein B0H13DRAFT_1875053 [Mycena leptocephala]